MLWYGGLAYAVEAPEVAGYMEDDGLGRVMLHDGKVAWGRAKHEVA